MRAHGPSHGTRVAAGTPSSEAYRRLSVRVIDQALRDIVAAPGSASDRNSARDFLAGSPMLDLWCGVAALDPARVVAHAGRLMDRRPTFFRPARHPERSVPADSVKSTV
ncbi:MAG: hypothetical protein ACRD09_13260 [Vicinamibacterales bacterium]